MERRSARCSVSERSRKFLLIAVGAVFVAIFGGYLARNFAPLAQPPQLQSEQLRRPILQIVRNQPGLPSLADTISTLCPSIGGIAPPGATGSVASGFAISVTAGSWLRLRRFQKASWSTFGAGPAIAVTEERSDPVSGLGIIKTDTTWTAPHTPCRPGIPTRW